jgi:hypothetical protein
MSDLVKRLRDCEFMGMPDARLDYSTATEAADRIEALEARIAKADALADILQSAIIEHDTADYSPDEENPWTMQEWFSDEDRAALAAYREGSDT